MSNDFRITGDQPKPLATGRGACFATNLVAEEGHEVGYMYRQAPQHETDSGWVFTAGTESQEYLDDPENTAIYDVNTIANLDPKIIPFLDAPTGSAFARNAQTGAFEQEAASPRIESSALTGYTNTPEIPTAPDFCDECGRPLESGEFEIRSKTDTQVLGIVSFHRSVHLALCRQCAQTRDGTADLMIWGLTALVGVLLVVGLSCWILPWVFR